MSMTAEEILKALLEEFFIQDYIYDMRERDREAGWEGDNWEGPLVMRYSKLMNAAATITGVKI